MSKHATNIVVVALIYEGDKILVMRRAATKSFHPSMFECPGGHLELDETPEEGLRREVMEEIDCKIRVDQLIDAFTYRDDEAFKVELSYLCALVQGEVPKLNPIDHSELLWITAAEIHKFEKEDEETEALRKAFKILQGDTHE